MRGLPLLPFGFGGSIGYLRGLPLPRLDSCIISLFVSTNCLSVFILFSLLLSCNCDSEIEIFGILLTAIFAFSSLILKSEAVLFCIPLNIPVLSSKSSIPISFVFDSLSNLSLASPKLLNPETSIFSLFIVCTGSFSVAIGFLLFILSSFLLEDNVLFALLFDISSNSSSVYTFLSFFIFILLGIITFPVIRGSLCLLSIKSIPLLKFALLFVFSVLVLLSISFLLFSLSFSLFSFSIFCLNFLSFSICSSLRCSCIFLFCFLSSSVSSEYVTNS